MDKKHYYVQNGKLIKAADRAVPKILVGSADDLELIKDKVTPGSEAHTPGYANVWELSPERKWKSKVFADEDRLYDELVKMQFSEIAADVKSIGSWAFDAQNKLIKASFPECITVGASAFQNCTHLEQIYLPKCEVIEGSAFYNTGLSEVSLPNCIEIGSNVFYASPSISALYAPSCKIIWDRAFQNCINLKIAEIPACESIGQYAFYSCNLQSISLPMCKTIQDSAFSRCSALTDVYMASTEMTRTTANPGFGSDVTIHVPSELLETYQSANYWSAYSSQFVSL